MSSDLPREQLSALVASFMSYSAGHLPDDVKLRLSQMKEIENEGFAPDIYNVMEKNMQLADSLKRPSCQDTGIPQFFARVGSKWPYMDIIEDALIDAVKEATKNAPLRLMRSRFSMRRIPVTTSVPTVHGSTGRSLKTAMNWNSISTWQAADAHCPASPKSLCLLKDTKASQRQFSSR